MPGPAYSTLVITERSPITGRIVAIVPDATIGRHGCDVVLPDPEVSRVHAAFRVRNGRPLIEDLGSTNGTWLNERRVAGAIAIGAGDVIRMGNTIWRVGTGDESGPDVATRITLEPPAKGEAGR